MGATMSLNDILVKIQGGLSRVIWKGVKHAGTASAGLATAMALKYFHVQLSDEIIASIGVGVSAGIGAGINWLKQAFPTKLGWL